MKADKLIVMANQIGEFFEAYPSKEEVEAGIADHLKASWNSVMINAISAHVKENDGQGLRPSVKAAIQQHIA
jgi:formate dehydrogenase subunit delta